MEEFASEFAAKLALTEDDKQRELVVEWGSVYSLRKTNFLLVGKLLTQKSFSGEMLMRTMTALWPPKVKVLASQLEENLFMFSFPTNKERSRILSGGPWSFNRFILVLAVADDIVQPYKILLVKQKFWVQIKGLPLVYMTKDIGKQIGEALGGYAVSDHCKKGEHCGNYLRIRVGLDVRKPLRWCMPVHDDLAKPYGHWFQEDISALDYRRPTGWRFGLPSQPWSMCAPEAVGDDEMAETAESTFGQNDDEIRADLD
ncbi:PREDICTED: At4g02000, partial [Prunus dulcis]